MVIVITVIVIFGFQYFFPKTTPPAGQEQTQTQPEAVGPSQTQEIAGQLLPREDALKETPQRLPIQTGTVKGSLNLQGAKLDDLVLTQYHETVDPLSPEIVLLSPENTPHAYYTRFGWSGAQVKLPDENTLWQAQEGMLTTQSPVTLAWDNGEGLTFSQVFSIDENYMFTITQRIKNTSEATLSLAPTGFLAKRGEPKSSGFFILHLGPVGVFEGKLNDPSYEDLAKTGLIQNPKTTGWFGLTDKYWLTAFVPDPKAPITSSYSQKGEGDNTVVMAQYQRDPFNLAPGQSLESTDYFFAGAKILSLLDGYEETIGMNHFDLAVDFGWFYFLTKPIFYALDFLKGILGNFGLAILALTVFIKLLFFPLANKSYSSMGKMKVLQPEIEKIRARYKDDRMKMNEKVMELYKKEKVNPMAGCLPMIIQIPVFFALYKVLFVSIEMRHAPFYGWIHDLSAPDPTTIFNLFGLIPWDPPSFLMIGAWPIIMGATMFLQQKLSPPPADPTQAKMFLFMPFIFTYILAQFPAGLVIYWAWNNTLSIAQQWVIMRRAERKKKRHDSSSAK